MAPVIGHVRRTNARHVHKPGAEAETPRTRGLRRRRPRPAGFPFQAVSIEADGVWSKSETG